MYFRALMLSGCVALAGCQSPQVIVEQNAVESAQVVSSLSALQSTKMKLPSNVLVDITPSTQNLKYGQINGPVAAFEIPANRGELEITITSHIKDSVFFPS
ncbi:MalM family protein, partial [Vibrio paucivorans]